MEPRRDEGYELSPPESLRSRGAPSAYARTPYSRVSSVEDDPGYTNPRISQRCSSPPVLPAVSEMTGLPAFGLGISDSRGQLPGGPPTEHSVVRATSDPFSDSERITRDRAQAGVRFPSFNTVEGSDIDSAGKGSPQTALNTPRINFENWDNVNCPSRRNVIQKRTSWLSISILILAFYSTAFSGVYLVAAFVKPRFGKGIGAGGMAPSTASLLSAFFAKTIELTFVTVFVAFLGQVLTRRSLSKRAHGVTIAEMSMRGWIMQPGTLITHWENVRYAGLSFLGMTSLTAALMALLYTTAAETLVSPKLRILPEEETILYGQVRTKFANSTWLNMNCETPIAVSEDPVHRNATCIQMYHVGQAYHNYQRFLERWGSEPPVQNESNPSLKDRLDPTGTWYDNTTVTGKWIEIQDTAIASKKYGRMINNVTAAMPHAGVLTAVNDEANNLRQPDELGGQGQYQIFATVPSPYINVLCVGMTKKELEPLIYVEWPHAGEFNLSEWSGNNLPPDAPKEGKFNNRTVVDDIFGWGEDKRAPPFFPKYPNDFQSLINVTMPYPGSVYVLMASPPTTPDPPFTLCGLNGGLATTCSTEYLVTEKGGQLRARCDKENPTAYRQKEPDIPVLNEDPDWAILASEWAKSINLADGLTDGKSSNARLLSLLVPPFNNETKEAHLLPNQPSIAEALATLAGSTLLLSTEHSQFTHAWPYPPGTIPVGGSVYENFSATIAVSDYASGVSESWQNIFFIVLISVFLTNVICLVYLYFGIRGVQLTDFTEPQNAFALALNSPPSSRISGACGGGPEGPQLNEKWVVSMDEHYEHYLFTSKAENKDIMQASLLKHQQLSPGLTAEPPASPAVLEYRRLSQTKGSLSLLQR